MNNVGAVNCSYCGVLIDQIMPVLVVGRDLGNEVDHRKRPKFMIFQLAEMVVDPTIILPEKLAPSLVMVVPVAQTRKQAMLSVMDDHVVPLTKQGFLVVMVDHMVPLDRLVAM